MNYRFMRIIIFFDLPTLTSANRRHYRKFVKEMKKEGFIMLQESVYTKLAITHAQSQLIKGRLNKHLPPEGLVFALTVTEKQFGDMDILVGENQTNIVSDGSRLVEL